MPSKPLFLVTKKGTVKYRSPADQYTGYNATTDMWRVAMIHTYFVGVAMDLYFESRPQADAFAEWQLYDQMMLTTMLGAQEPWVCQPMQKTKWRGAPNPYLDIAILMDSWIVPFDNPHGKKLHLRFPNLGSANRYRQYGSYLTQDLFGTMPSVPSQVAEARLEAFLAAQKAKAKAAAKAAAAAAASGSSGSSGGGSSGGSGSSSSGSAGNIQVQPPPPTGTPQWWTITSGGAAGYYNGVYYSSGTVNVGVQDQVLFKYSQSFNAYEYTLLNDGTVKISNDPVPISNPGRIVLQSGAFAEIAQGGQKASTLAAFNEIFGASAPWEWYGVYTPVGGSNTGSTV